MKDLVGRQSGGGLERVRTGEGQRLPPRLERRHALRQMNFQQGTQALKPKEPLLPPLKEQEEHPEHVDQVLDRQKQERDSELDTLRGGREPDREYRGTGLGLALREVVEDARLDYQLDRDTDQMGLGKRLAVKSGRKVKEGVKEAWEGTKEAFGSVEGMKKQGTKALKQGFDKGVNFIPLVGGVRELATGGKEHQRVKQMGRLRDDQEVPEVGRKMAGGFVHQHKRERLQKGIGTVGSVLGEVVGGPLVTGGKLLAKGTVALTDEALVKHDRKTRLEARLPEQKEGEGEQEHRERVDHANESLAGLLKEDPTFSKQLLGHLSNTPQLSHGQELEKAREDQELGEDDLLKPSKVQEFGRKEGGRLALREALGADPSWTPEQERLDAHADEERSNLEHAELDRQMDRRGLKDARQELNACMKRDLKEVQADFAKRRKALGGPAKERRADLQRRADEEIAEAEAQRDEALEKIDAGLPGERFFAGRQRESGKLDKADHKHRLAVIQRQADEKRKTARDACAGRLRQVKDRLKQELRQAELDDRKERLDLDAEAVQARLDCRARHAVLKRRAIGDEVPDVPKDQGKLPVREPRRNVLSEMNRIEKVSSWEKH